MHHPQTMASIKWVRGRVAETPVGADTGSVPRKTSRTSAAAEIEKRSRQSCDADTSRHHSGN